MGKKTGNTDTDHSSAPKEQYNRSVSSYFPHKMGETWSSLTGTEAPTMADENIELDQEQKNVTCNDLKNMEEVIIDKIAALLKPILGQFDAIKVTMADTNANTAGGISCTTI